MSENGDQFIVDGRKSGSTCKLHSVSRSSAETIPAPDERESETRWKMTLHGGTAKIPLLHFTLRGGTLYSAHGGHFHHCMKYTNAIIIVNMIAGMDNLSLLAAQPLPTQFSPCAGWGEKLTSI